MCANMCEVSMCVVGVRVCARVPGGAKVRGIVNLFNLEG
jgi:hypothetical protein